MRDVRSLNLEISDRVFSTWRCWVSDHILGKETNGMRKGSIIHIRNYGLQFLPHIGIFTMIIKAVQVLSGEGNQLLWMDPWVTAWKHQETGPQVWRV
jgi:hypothetical protein